MPVVGGALMGYRLHSAREESRDPVTGLLHRPHFNKWLKRQLPVLKRNQRIQAMLAEADQRGNLGIEERLRLLRKISPRRAMVVDADNLKMLNDVFGYPTGNRYLRAIAAGAQRTHRSYEVVSKLQEGDEFVIGGGPDLDHVAAEAIVKRLKEPVEQFREELVAELRREYRGAPASQRREIARRRLALRKFRPGLSYVLVDLEPRHVLMNELETEIRARMHEVKARNREAYRRV